MIPQIDRLNSAQSAAIVTALTDARVENHTTAELRGMTDAELQERFHKVRLFLNRNNLVPAAYRATRDPATKRKERRYMSESSRILAIAARRGLTLRYPTRDEIVSRSLFK